MLLAFQQRLDPLGSPFLSTAFAALPVVVLFWLLVPSGYFLTLRLSGNRSLARLVHPQVRQFPCRDRARGREARKHRHSQRFAERHRGAHAADRE